jgi:hypothetical protein
VERLEHEAQVLAPPQRPRVGVERSVDLPTPDSPISTTNSPAAIRSDTCRNTGTSP